MDWGDVTGGVTFVQVFTIRDGEWCCGRDGAQGINWMAVQLGPAGRRCHNLVHWGQAGRLSHVIVQFVYWTSRRWRRRRARIPPKARSRALVGSGTACRLKLSTTKAPPPVASLDTSRLILLMASPAVWVT